jgi:TPR repeat protein
MTATVPARRGTLLRRLARALPGARRRARRGALADRDRAAADPTGEAAYALAERLEHGQGVLPSPADALPWYRLAAERSHAEAQAHLARLLLTGGPAPAWAGGIGRKLAGEAAPGHALFPNGSAVSRDLPEARRWAAAAAERGSVRGQALLGYLLAAGLGGPHDPMAAQRWYRLAAEAGNAEAQLGLGTLLASGQLGEPDYTAAHAWFERADAQGNV